MKGRVHSIISGLLILWSSSCVDRLILDTGVKTYPVVIDGFISDQPGPYLIKVTSSYDIQSKTQIRVPLAVN